MSAVLAPQPDVAARSIRAIVIHCSATPSGQRLGGGRLSAAAVIDRWHAERGFRRQPDALRRYGGLLTAIGYHYVIDLDGSVERGRSLAEVGAHVAGFNTGTVGICLVGGAERDARYTRAQWVALEGLVRRLCAQLQLPLLHPLYPRTGAGVCGHRDLSPDTNADGQVQPQEWLKTCPGFDVSAWLARGMVPLRDQVCQEAA